MTGPTAGSAVDPKTVKAGDRVQIAEKGEQWTVLQVWSNGTVTIQGTRANSFGQVAKRTVSIDKIKHHKKAAR